MNDLDLEPNPFHVKWPRPTLTGFAYLAGWAIFAMPWLFIWWGLVHLFDGHTRCSMVPGVEDIIWIWINIHYWYSHLGSAMLAVGYIMYIMLGLVTLGVL